MFTLVLTQGRGRRPALSALAFLALALLAGGARATTVTVLPGYGVSFQQVDFTRPGATFLNSDTGLLRVDVAALRSQTGIRSGYLNVSTSLGWVVHNLPVLQDFPYPLLATRFALGNTPGTDVSSLTATVQLSSDPVTLFAASPGQNFTVGTFEYNAQGVAGPVPTGPSPPPPVAPPPFVPGGPTHGTFQPGHPNVEAALNQCLPAAVANSLQWLEDQCGIKVPDPNVPGVNGDGSLVGALDVKMMRMPGQATQIVNGLIGKVSYLDMNGLGGLDLKHQGQIGDVTQGSATSHNQGTQVTAGFLQEQIDEGEDVELIYLYTGGGGHAVELVGAGETLGVPWVMHTSDLVQDDPTRGTDLVEQSYLFDTDGDGRLNINDGSNANLAAAFSESVPENQDTVLPTCVLESASSSGIVVKVQDTCGGLASVTHAESNAGVTVDSFQPGTVSPVRITATKTDPSRSSRLEVWATDQAGNQIYCDPAVALILREPGRPVPEKIAHLPQAEDQVTLMNGNPGLHNLRIRVNGVDYPLAGLKDGETRTINVASAMHAGNRNTIILTAHGRPGSATVVIHE